MTAKQAQTIEQALARAQAEGIRIIGKGHMTVGVGNRFFLVTSKDYERTNRVYVVTEAGFHLTCTCRAQGICKHRAVVHAFLKAEAEAERLADATQTPRELANVETSEAEKLETVADSYGQMIDRLSNTDAFWQDAPVEQPEPVLDTDEVNERYAKALARLYDAEPAQRERSAKREAAILHRDNRAFSIFAAE